MAEKIEQKKLTLEREYIIPLRKAWLKVPMYERTGSAIKEIKRFIAKHMKVEDRDISKVKLDVYFNNEIWFKGRANPPGKVKVRAIKEDGIIKVNFVEIPEKVKFLKLRHEKQEKALEKKEEAKPEEAKKEPAEQKKEEKTEEQKKDEKEKEKATAESRAKEFESQAKAQKHVTKAETAKRQQRMALKK